MKRVVSMILLCSALLVTPAFAHSGRTDGDGGHYNRSTGEYHYHHGYPAHLHIGGICPYEFDDKTNHGSSYSKPNEQIKERKEEKQNRIAIPPAFFLVASAVGITACSVVAVRRRIERRKEAEERKLLRKQWDEEYDGKLFDEIFKPPRGFTIGEDGVPVCSCLTESELVVYASIPGGKYHRKSCRYAFYPPCSLWEAQRCGCTPCKVCSPPSYDFSWYWRYVALKKEMVTRGIKVVLEDDTIFLEDEEAEKMENRKSN